MYNSNQIDILKYEMYYLYAACNIIPQIFEFPATLPARLLNKIIDNVGTLALRGRYDGGGPVVRLDWRAGDGGVRHRFW